MNKFTEFLKDMSQQQHQLIHFDQLEKFISQPIFLLLQPFLLIVAREILNNQSIKWVVESEDLNLSNNQFLITMNKSW